MVENYQLILQAIESAERSLSVAKQLLGGTAGTMGGVSSKYTELLGEVGTFDGENLIAESGRKYQVPPNYASKSLLVVGDVLRMVEGSDGIKRFKQIQKVPCLKLTGMLTKKDGEWAVVTQLGTFKVLPASVKHFEGEIGDAVSMIIPKEYRKLRANWAALEKVLKKEEVAPDKFEVKQDQAKKEKSFAPPEEKPHVSLSKKTVQAPQKPIAEKATKAQKSPSPRKEEKVKEKPEVEKKAELKGEIKLEEEELR